MSSSESIARADAIRMRLQANSGLRLEFLAAVSKVFREYGLQLSDELLSSLTLALPEELVGTSPAPRALASEAVDSAPQQTDSGIGPPQTGSAVGPPQTGSAVGPPQTGPGVGPPQTGSGGGPTPTGPPPAVGPPQTGSGVGPPQTGKHRSTAKGAARSSSAKKRGKTK